MKKIILIPLLISLFVINGYASKHYGNTHISRVESVYDGDTFKVDIDWWPSLVGNDISIRINGIDTPEKRDSRPSVKKLAMMARDYTDAQLKNAKVIELRNIRRGKYFRIIADVYIDGKNLADMLLKMGFAKEYYGGKRPTW